MKAMILAAGRGERMRPLTDNCPKPLLKVAGIPLIEHHIKKLAAAGINEIVINHAWLGQQIENYLGKGDKWGVTISYSAEGDNALETAGGIVNALPLLVENIDNDDPFLVVNGDVYTDFEFTHLPELGVNLAHLWLVKNPSHNLNGDFSLNNSQVINITNNKESCTYTFSGIGLYRPSFFHVKHHHENKPAVLPLAPMLRAEIAKNNVSGTIINKSWTDVGTPERLNELNK